MADGHAGAAEHERGGARPELAQRVVGVRHRRLALERQLRRRLAARLEQVERVGDQVAHGARREARDGHVRGAFAVAGGDGDDGVADRRVEAHPQPLRGRDGADVPVKPRPVERRPVALALGEHQAGAERARRARRGGDLDAHAQAVERVEERRLDAARDARGHGVQPELTQRRRLLRRARHARLELLAPAAAEG